MKKAVKTKRFWGIVLCVLSIVAKHVLDLPIPDDFINAALTGGGTLLTAGVVDASKKTNV